MSQISFFFLCIVEININKWFDFSAFYKLYERHSWYIYSTITTIVKDFTGASMLSGKGALTYIIFSSIIQSIIEKVTLN